LVAEETKIIDEITFNIQRKIENNFIIKDIYFPKITAYANSLYVYLDKENLPTVKELEEVVNYLSLDLNKEGNGI
jgi:hypothetical protein